MRSSRAGAGPTRAASSTPASPVRSARRSRAGESPRAVEAFAGRRPILGVCLGHQAIGEVFGGRIVRAETLMHGKTSLIHHDRRTIYEGVPDPFVATRYHSLVVARESVPAE